VVARTLEPALDSVARKRGLLGRDGLPDGHALIIAPCSIVHTFFMRFPVDILVVARTGVVLKAARDVPSRRLSGAWGGFAVVEMRSGSVDRSDTRAGDVLSLFQSDKVTP
jgi:hypothetical protein